ncbi:MAG: hypothetical protein ACP5JG_00690 [Anaerolineae bacterium]
MSWMDFIERDPVPWLLDPTNPSARLLTLREIFDRSEETLSEEYDRLLAWQPVRALRRHWDSHNFWGRAGNPYFGGAAGTFGTLYLLTQLGVPNIPEVESTCIDLLDNGRREDGRFGPEGTAAAPWLAYSGMVLHIMIHFGYEDDPRTQSAWGRAIQAVHADPERLDCPTEDMACRAGAIKLLKALLSRDSATRTTADESVIDFLCEYLLKHSWDWQDADRGWMQCRFPRFYDTDLIEFCHVLSETPYRAHPRCQETAQQMIGLQDASGRWSKMKATPAFSEERINQPSRWLTLEAVHSLMQIYGDETYAARGSRSA